jgi:hypothetical protein
VFTGVVQDYSLREGVCEKELPVAAIARYREHLAAIADGREVYDAAAAGACIRALSSMCTVDGGSRACAVIFRGTAAEGAACSEQAPCAQGLYCHFERSERGPLATCGVCKPQLAKDAPCQTDQACEQRSEGEPQFFCKAGNSGVRCREYRVTMATAGQACGVTEEADHTRLVSCGEGSLCIEGRCSASQTSGAKCPLHGCARGYYCKPTQFVVNDGAASPVAGECAALSVVPEGGACDDVGRVCDRSQRLVCDGTCRRLGDGSEGSRCGVNDEAYCEDGLRCEWQGHLALCVQPPTGCAPP